MDPMPPSAGLTPTPATPGPDTDIEQNKDMAALSYAWILSVIIFFARKDSPFTRSRGWCSFF